MQLRYLRHCHDVVYDYWIAAVRKSAVWIFAAIKYSITPVVLGCGHQKILEGILEGCSHGKTTSVSLVRIRFDAIFADTRWIIHSNHPTVIGLVCLQSLSF